MGFIKWPQLLRVIRNIREIEKAKVKKREPIETKEKCKWVGRTVSCG